MTRKNSRMPEIIRENYQKLEIDPITQEEILIDALILAKFHSQYDKGTDQESLCFIGKENHVAAFIIILSAFRNRIFDRHFNFRVSRIFNLEYFLLKTNIMTGFRLTIAANNISIRNNTEESAESPDPNDTGSLDMDGIMAFFGKGTDEGNAQFIKDMVGEYCMYERYRELSYELALCKELDCESLKFWELLGLYNHYADNFALAEYCMSEKILIDTDNPSVWMGLFNICMRSKKTEKANAIYEDIMIFMNENGCNNKFKQ